MVNVGEKQPTHRMAWARSLVILPVDLLDQLKDQELWLPKGPVFQTAIIAGTMAAKKTGELIPLCHPVGLEDCKFNIEINPEREVVIDCQVSVNAKTGVEMEALTGASVAALTIYDMCKGFSHNIMIKETKLMEKTGGKNDFRR